MVAVYTDGSCFYGVAGIGVVVLDEHHRIEVSDFIGPGTCNIAELIALVRALETVADRADEPVVVHSDSAYAIDVATSSDEVRHNRSLVARCRALVRGFSDLSFVKVKSHSGVEWNERCDFLAKLAANRGRQSVMTDWGLWMTPDRCRVDLATLARGPSPHYDSRSDPTTACYQRTCGCAARSALVARFIGRTYAEAVQCRDEYLTWAD